jgi:glycosyltransferase involved in cell wall biosynthesis
MRDSHVKLALALVVKNESAVVRRAIESGALLVDCVVVIDTGSTDDTVEIVQQTCEDLRIPLHLSRSEWRDFATNQTELIQAAAQRADYAWLLDADEVATYPEDWRFPELTADGYEYCRLWAGDWEVWGTKIFRTSKPWRYVGKRHAIPKLEGANVRRLHELEVENRRDGANGKTSAAEQRERFLADVRTFSRQRIADPSDTRAAYYLAQSYHDAGLPELALVAYQVRANMDGGFDEERYISLLQVARYKRRLRHSPEEVEAAYLATHRSRPQRHEAMVELARWYNERDQPADASLFAYKARVAPRTDDRFLVQRSAYTWRPVYENARAFAGGHLEIFHGLLKQLLTFDNLPAPERAWATRRLKAA